MRRRKHSVRANIITPSSTAMFDNPLFHGGQVPVESVCKLDAYANKRRYRERLKERSEARRWDAY